jgi:hypothetical protein
VYIVQNMTRHEIALGDLRAIIRPGKQEDLDRFADRYVVEQSKDLRIAFKRGALRLVRKDNPFGGVATDPKPATPVKESQPDVMGALKEMEKRLTQRLDNQVEKHVGAGGGLDEDSVSKLNDAIAALQGLAQGGGGAVAQPHQETEEYDVEDEKVVDIHERSINRLTKGAESKIQHKEETSKSDADANISELEDLL